MTLTQSGAERTRLLTVNYLDKLQRANADDLAFYPISTLAEALADGHVIACEDNGEPAGYLWFGMVGELVAIATAAGCTGIRLKCASSADSNEFWRAAGFACTRVTPGGVKRGRDINWYRAEIQAGLWTFPEVTPSERPIDLTEYQRLKRAAVKMPSRFSRSHLLMDPLTPRQSEALALLASDTAAFAALAPLSRGVVRVTVARG